MPIPSVFQKNGLRVVVLLLFVLVFAAFPQKTDASDLDMGGEGKCACSPWAEPYVREFFTYYASVAEAGTTDFTQPVDAGTFAGFFAGIRFLFVEQPPALAAIQESADALSALNAFASSSYEADHLLTRGETAAFLSLAEKELGFPAGFYDNAPGEAPVFSDFSDPAAALALHAGLMVGREDGRFDPEDFLTVEQAAAVLVRLTQSGVSRYAMGELTVGYTSFWLWVEDGNGTVLLRFPRLLKTYDYRSFGVTTWTEGERNGEEILALGAVGISPGREEPGYYLLNARTGELLLSLDPACGFPCFVGTDAIVTWDTRYESPTVDAAYTVYGVYDWEGNALLPLGADWDEVQNFMGLYGWGAAPNPAQGTFEKVP